MTEANDRFQVDLRGLIDLLSNHLYESPGTFVRELLQNGTDAITARADDFEPRIELTIGDSDTGRPILTIEDNGVGLTLDEATHFLATIGESSKRGSDAGFIGQFGIGLLSAFVVSDEITVLTRSVKSEVCVEWRGRADGTYEVRERPDIELPVGTVVELIAKPGAEAHFEQDAIVELATKYGGVLPFPVFVSGRTGSRQINALAPPWRQESPTRQALLTYGQRVLGSEFIDAIPLALDEFGVKGVAYVLASSPSPAARPQHRVYLKSMLISEAADNLLPKWAFFVRCVLDTENLRPTASRDTFYEDDRLRETRAALGRALGAFLLQLKVEDPARLRALLSIHFVAIKALSAHDPNFLAVFLDSLPFETTLGRMEFREIRERFAEIRWVTTVDAFRQIAQVAAAQGIGIINAGYSYDAEVLQQASHVLPDLTFREVEPTDLAAAFQEIDSARLDEFATLLACAAEAFPPGRFEVQVRAFRPEHLPALYATSSDHRFLRQISKAKESLSGPWAGVLDELEQSTQTLQPTLYLNAKNPLVRRLARTDDLRVCMLSLRMLYVQALLLGHHPLSADELAMLNVGLIDLIEAALEEGGEVLQ